MSSSLGRASNVVATAPRAPRLKVTKLADATPELKAAAKAMNGVWSADARDQLRAIADKQGVEITDAGFTAMYFFCRRDHRRAPVAQQKRRVAARAKKRNTTDKETDDMVAVEDDTSTNDASSISAPSTSDKSKDVDNSMKQRASAANAAVMFLYSSPLFRQAVVEIPETARRRSSIVGHICALFTELDENENPIDALPLITAMCMQNLLDGKSNLPLDPTNVLHRLLQHRTATTRFDFIGVTRHSFKFRLECEEKHCLSSIGSVVVNPWMLQKFPEYEEGQTVTTQQLYTDALVSACGEFDFWQRPCTCNNQSQVVPQFVEYAFGDHLILHFEPDKAAVLARTRMGYTKTIPCVQNPSNWWELSAFILRNPTKEGHFYSAYRDSERWRVSDQVTTDVFQRDDTQFYQRRGRVAPLMVLYTYVKAD